MRYLFALAALGPMIAFLGRQSGRESVPTRGQAVEGVLLAAVVSALLIGWIEIGLVFFRQVVQHRFAFWTTGVAWMTPVVYVLLFAVPAALLALVAVARPRWVPVPVAVFLFSLLGAGSLSYSFPRLHPYSLAVLALGIAWQGMRWAAVDPAATRARLRRWLKLAGGFTLLAILMSSAWTGTRSLRTRIALGAGDPSRPNVLLLILDTVRSESMSLYGYSRPTTPRIDSFAARGTVFEWAIAPFPWTLGTHASLFTGKAGYQMEAGNRVPLGAEHVTLAETLGDAGYATAHIVANARYAGRETGLAQGARYIDDYQGLSEPLLSHAWLGQSFGVQGLVGARSLGEVLSAAANFSPWVPFQREVERREAGEINASFLRWLDGLGHRPFYAFLNYFDAHRPYEPPPEERARFVDGSVPDVRGLYDGTIAHLDREIGALLDALEDRGVLHNTIVVISSDHGEQVKDRGRTGHGDRLYSQLIRVPLVIVASGRVPAQRVQTMVSLTDVAATILELTGVDPRLPGTSLVRVWEDNDFDPGLALAEAFHGPDGPPARLRADRAFQSKTLLDQRFHYIWTLQRDSTTGDYSIPFEELFDYRNDPREEFDLAADPEFADVLARMQDSLIARFPVEDPEVAPRSGPGGG